MKTTAGCRPVCVESATYGLVLAVSLILLSGCAAHTGATSPLASHKPDVSPVLVADASLKTTPSAEPALEVSPEEPFDPFAKAGEEAVEEYDPWEPLNTKFFEFNRQLDRWVLKPVAKGYNYVVPNIVQVGVSNIFYNSRATPRFMNNMFQGKFKGAGIEVGDFSLIRLLGSADFSMWLNG
ncbi:MAG: MlaA family lipoprotein [Nitrospira sp.]